MMDEGSENSKKYVFGVTFYTAFTKIAFNKKNISCIAANEQDAWDRMAEYRALCETNDKDNIILVPDDFELIDVEKVET